LREVGRRHKERRGCRVVFVSVVIVAAAVQAVGTALDREIDGSTGIASGLGIGLALGGEFVNGVNRHDRARDSGNAALIDSWNVVPEIVVVGAVNLPVHLVGAGSIQRAETADGIASVAGVNG